MLTSTEDYDGDVEVDIVKIAENLCEGEENEVQVKLKGSVDQKFNNVPQYFSNNMLTSKDDNNDIVKTGKNSVCDGEEYKVEVERKNFVEAEDYLCDNNGESVIKIDQHNSDSLEAGVVLPQSKVFDQKSSSQIPIHQRKLKSSLKKHVLTHKNPSEIMHQCNICSFETNCKDYLKKHVYMHSLKSPSKITVHQCNICSFQTKHKFGLRKHMLLHKLSSKMTMRQCNIHSFQTKYEEFLSGI